MIKKEIRTSTITETIYKTTSGATFDNVYDAKLTELTNYLANGPYSKVGYNADYALKLARKLLDIDYELNKVHIDSIVGWRNILEILRYKDA